MKTGGLPSAGGGPPPGIRRSICVLYATSYCALVHPATTYVSVKMPSDANWTVNVLPVDTLKFAVLNAAKHRHNPDVAATDVTIAAYLTADKTDDEAVKIGSVASNLTDPPDSTHVLDASVVPPAG